MLSQVTAFLCRILVTCVVSSMQLRDLLPAESPLAEQKTKIGVMWEREFTMTWSLLKPEGGYIFQYLKEGIWKSRGILDVLHSSVLALCSSQGYIT